jgi:hypothetical protein
LLPPDRETDDTVPVSPETVTVVIGLVIEFAKAVRLTVPSLHPDMVLLAFQLAVPVLFIKDHMNDGCVVSGFPYVSYAVAVNTGVTLPDVTDTEPPEITIELTAPLPPTTNVS